MKIKRMNWLVKLITFNWPAAITLAPFGIYIKEDYFKREDYIRHETIHWKQQMEMLIIFFYIWYLVEWFIKLFIHGKQAYYEISFEREAYQEESTIQRKRFNWVKYL